MNVLRKNVLKAGQIGLLLISSCLWVGCGVDIGFEPAAEPAASSAIEAVPTLNQVPTLLSVTEAPLVPTPEVDQSEAGLDEVDQVVQAPTALPPESPDATSEEEPTPISYLSQGDGDGLTLLSTASEFYGVNLVGTIDAEGDNPDGEIAWGDAYCPLGVNVCVRPLAVEYEGETAIIVSEIFGLGSQPYFPENSKVGWSIELYSEFDSQFGSTCRNTFERISGYQEGLGHLNFECVNLSYLDEDPLGVEVRFSGSANGAARFPIGDPLPRTENVALSGIPLELNKPYPVNAFEVTIHSFEELEDSVVFDVTVTNLTERKQVIENPEWIVFGQGLKFYTADQSGFYKEWMESRMNMFDVIGGGLNPKETVTGAVVLEKASDDWQLVFTYGNWTNAIYWVLDPPAEMPNGGDEG